MPRKVHSLICLQYTAPMNVSRALSLPLLKVLSTSQMSRKEFGKKENADFLLIRPGWIPWAYYLSVPTNTKHLNLFHPNAHSTDTSMMDSAGRVSPRNNLS